MRRASSLGAFALLGSAVLIWGTGYWPTAIGAEHAANVTLAGLRTSGGGVTLVALAVLTRARFPRGALLGWAVLTGVTMIALSLWGTTEAVARAGPGNAAIVINSAPLLVAALGWIILRERLSPFALLGVLTGFGGVVLMVSSQLGGTVDTAQLLLGAGLAMTGAVGWATGTLMLRALAQREGELDMLGFTAVQFAVAGTLLLSVGFAVEGAMATDWSAPALWAVFVWIGPVNTLGVVMFFVALSRLAAARASAALFLVPAVAVIVEIARGNAPGPLVLLGMVLAVLGVAMVNAPPQQLVAAARRAVSPRLRRTPRG